MCPKMHHNPFYCLCKTKRYFNCLIAAPYLPCKQNTTRMIMPTQIKIRYLNLWVRGRHNMDLVPDGYHMPLSKLPKGSTGCSGGQ